MINYNARQSMPLNASTDLLQWQKLTNLLLKQITTLLIRFSADNLAAYAPQ